MTATAIPASAKKPRETYAYSLPEIEAMLRILPEPAATVVAVAAFTGLRRGEIKGLLWDDYFAPETDETGTVRVTRSVWRSEVTAPKTTKSIAPVPVISPVAQRLALHRKLRGNPADGPIFVNSLGRPLDLNEVYRRTMASILTAAGISWHGWHAFRRGLATNLHALGVDDKTIQAILRHSNISTTQNVYIKSVPHDAISAMKRLEKQLSATSSMN